MDRDEGILVDTKAEIDSAVHDPVGYDETFEQKGGKHRPGLYEKDIAEEPKDLFFTQRLPAITKPAFSLCW